MAGTVDLDGNARVYDGTDPTNALSALTIVNVGSVPPDMVRRGAACRARSTRFWCTTNLLSTNWWGQMK
ncbi:hypothetical protein ACFLSJ_07795 [Verrucomicrobiota bacterium]